MKAEGAGDLKIEWKAAGVATIKEIVPGKLLLKRAQNSGAMTVTATVSNGGAPTTHEVTIAVTEPKSDLWIARTTDFNSYETVSTANGAPQRKQGRMAASTAPGLGIAPKMDVLGAPVVVVG